MNKPLLVFLTVILFVPNLVKTNIFVEKGWDHKEAFIPSLAYLNSIEKINDHLDTICIQNKIAAGSYEYVHQLSKLLRQRFYHGYNHFAINENWIAVGVDKLLGNGVSCKVHPNDILQHANAACSQQAIVMMAVLRTQHIAYRHIGFPHHYALDVKIDGKWYFFDPNMEPVITKEQRCEDAWQYRCDSLKQYYASLNIDNANFIFGKGLTAEKGAINEEPAKHAGLFQAITGILSKVLWCIPMLLLIFSYKPSFSFNTNKTTPASILPA